MCGICGIVNFNNKPIDTELLKKMNNMLYHRGPDEEGFFISSKANVGFGIRRLSIIDLETGSQPIYNEDKSIAIVLNGEIYNFLELRRELEKKHRFKTKSDVEAVVHLYEEKGIDCLQNLRGMFALAIWDGNKKQLFLARDRIGKKPLYYTWLNGNFYFASEIKSFLAIPEFKKEINRKAIDLFLTYQYIPAPYTIWQNVYKVEAANFLCLDEEKRVIVKNYWDVDFREKTNLSFEESKERIRELLREATKLRMISDVPLGAFLSGGHDSSIVVGLMSEISSKPIQTFSIGFKEEEFSELRYARLIAKKFKTEHHEFIVEPKYIEILPKIVWHYDQPYADPSALPSYYISKMTRQFVKVALNGDGGDENFAGYLRYRALAISRYIGFLAKFFPEKLIDLLEKILPQKISAPNRKPWEEAVKFLRPLKQPLHRQNLLWHAYFTEEQKKYVYSDEMKKNLSKHDAYLYFENCFFESKATEFIDKILYTDIKTYLAENLLVKMDVASMANSLEARSPFLDHKFVEFTASLPWDWKLRGLDTKFILKETFKNFLPAKILRRKKQGFGIPLGQWFRNQWKDFLQETIFSSKAISRNYFNIKNLKVLVEDHIYGRKDHGYCLWALLMLELWHRVFVDGDINYSE